MADGWSLLFTFTVLFAFATLFAQCLLIVPEHVTYLPSANVSTVSQPAIARHAGAARRPARHNFTQEGAKAVAPGAALRASASGAGAGRLEARRPGGSRFDQPRSLPTTRIPSMRKPAAGGAAAGSTLSVWDGGASEEPVHVVLAADRKHLVGFLGVINSARAHTKRPQLLHFHLVVPAGTEQATSAFVRCRGLSLADGTVRVVGFDTSRLAGIIRVQATAKMTGNLSSPLNYARFFMPELVPGARMIAYLDVDVVVRGDLVKLARTVRLSPGLVAAAVPRELASFAYKRYPKAAKLFAQRRGKPFDPSERTFNAGLFLIDAARWQALGLTEEAVWWLRQNARSPSGLWKLGSQPPLHLILYKRWARLPSNWNLDGLGRKKGVREADRRAAKLLHWTGRHKPWLDDGYYQQEWTPYQGLTQPCAGQGECRADAGPREAPCKCAPGIQHDLCEPSTQARAASRRLSLSYE